VAAGIEQPPHTFGELWFGLLNNSPRGHGGEYSKPG
jgi:hypothetical protein